MRKLIASIFVSLDGYIVTAEETMDWVTEDFNDEMGDHITRLQEETDLIVLGRVTYEIMVGAWPNWGDEVEGSREMNDTPKLVVSTTLDKVEWGKYDNASLIKTNIAQEFIKLKQLPGKNMLIFGSGKLVSSLTEQGLIDELHLYVHPVILGNGKRLFENIQTEVPLKLLSTETYHNDAKSVVALVYGPKTD